MGDVDERQSWVGDLLANAAELIADLWAGDLSGVGDAWNDLLVDLPEIPPTTSALWAQIIGGESFLSKILGGFVDVASIIPSTMQMSSISTTLAVREWQRRYPNVLPDVGTLTHNWLWDVGFDTPLLNDRLLDLGYNPDRASWIRTAATPKPGMGELLAAFVREHGPSLTPATPSTGYPWADEWLPTYASATRTLPSPSEFVTLLARGLMTRPDYFEWLSRLNYDKGLSQNLAASLLTTLGPRDLSELSYSQARGRLWLDAELHRIEFDPHYTDMRLELTTRLPAALDYARYYRRTGLRGDLPEDEFMRLGWTPKRLPFIEEMSWSIPGPAEIARYHHRLNHEHDAYADSLIGVGLHPNYTDVVDKVSQATPSVSEYYRFKYRMESTGMTDHEALRRLGYDPDWWNVWETLSHPYPSVQDLILMAVREVFTPEVAERFGQFEEIPDAYIDAAKKTGLSEEWARNYWAAHWTLPSAQMGFDMLHRGVIERDDLNALFVALDIMPFWRDRISDISYRVLTRVDVRRMYALGVLDESGVLDAYLKLGYAPDNADKMTAFTLAFVRKQEIGYTRSQVLKAYKTRAIDRTEAVDMLALLGIHADDADFALDMEEFALESDLEDEQVDIIEAAFKKDLITWEDTSTALDSIGVEPARKTLLLNRWEVSRLRKQQTFSKAEVLRYYVSGSVDAKFAETELGRLGYDADRVRVLLDDAALRGKAERGPRKELSIAQATAMLKSGMLDVLTLKALLADYGWRDPELSMLVCDLAAAVKQPLPEGMEPCTAQSVSEMLSAS